MRRVGTAFLGLMLVLAVSGGQASADTNAAQRLAAHTPQLVQAGDGLSAAVGRGTISPAKAALLRAQALFHPAAVERSTGLTIRPGGREATPIMGLENSSSRKPTARSIARFGARPMPSVVRRLLR